MVIAKPESQIQKWIQTLAAIAALSIVPLFGWILSIERKLARVPDQIPPQWFVQRIDNMESMWSRRLDRLEIKVENQYEKLLQEVYKKIRESPRK